MFRTRSHLASGVLGVVAVLSVAGCPTVDLGETPPEVDQCRPDRLYFESTIWPTYLAPADINKSCVGTSGCHDSTSGRSALRLETNVVADPTAFDRNYAVVTRFLNCGSPDASALLTKPLAGIDVHGGGDIFADTGDASVDAFLLWFN